MAERALRQPAIAPQALRPRGVRLGERTGLGKIDLRGDPGDRAFMTGVGRVLDLLLRTEPNGSASKNTITALWLGPDQWLLTCPVDDPAAGPAFDVYVARSFAHYVWAWLEDAGLEYGVQVEPAG